MQKIFVSILNYNGKKDTIDCLNSLKNVRVKNFTINTVVVDNGSTEIFEIDENMYKDINLLVLRSETNLGFSGGHNKAIKYSLEKGADFIVILNNDVILDENILTGLLATFKDRSGCGLVSPKIYFAKGHEFHKDRYKKNDLGKVIWYAGGEMDWKNVIASHRGVDEVDKGQFESLEKTDFASGCCMMVKKEVFEKTGLFDEKYFLYYEDNDLCQRAKKEGFGIYFQPKGILWHINAGSTGGSGSEMQDYYITRNRLIFGFKYAPLRSKAAIFRESAGLLLGGRCWQKKGVTDYYLGNLGKGSYE